MRINTADVYSTRRVVCTYVNFVRFCMDITNVERIHIFNAVKWQFIIDILLIKFSNFLRRQFFRFISVWGKEVKSITTTKNMDAISYDIEGIFTRLANSGNVGRSGDSWKLPRNACRRWTTCQYWIGRHRQTKIVSLNGRQISRSKYRSAVRCC